MARNNRQRRVADEVRRIIAQTLQTEIKDPRLPFLTSVTEVTMSGDLSQATVMMSIPGDETQKSAGLDALESARGLFRSAVARGLTLRQAPELIFVLDRSLEQGMAIDAKLRELQQEREAREARQKDTDQSETEAGAEEAEDAEVAEASESDEMGEEQGQ